MLESSMRPIIDSLSSYIHGTVIDVGANEGGTVALLASHRPNKIVAMEPIAKYIPVIKKLVPDAEILNVAVGNKMDKCTMKMSGGDNSFVYGEDKIHDYPWTPPEYPSYEIEMITIDSLNLEDVNFIKIDVESYESEVLLGAKKTIQKCRPIILMETHFDGVSEKYKISDETETISDFIKNKIIKALNIIQYEKIDTKNLKLTSRFLINGTVETVVQNVILPPNQWVVGPKGFILK